jgi:hypothetical protein
MCCLWYRCLDVNDNLFPYYVLLCLTKGSCAVLLPVCNTSVQWTGHGSRVFGLISSYLMDCLYGCTVSSGQQGNSVIWQNTEKCRGRSWCLSRVFSLRCWKLLPRTIRFNAALFKLSIVKSYGDVAPFTCQRKGNVFPEFSILSKRRIDLTFKPLHHAECCPKNITRY